MKINFIRASLLAVAIGVAGCAGSPYIDSPTLGEKDPDNAEKAKVRGLGIKEGTMAFALRYLDYTRAAYDAKVTEEEDRKRGMMAGLTGLGAVILGTAASKDHSNRVGGLALIGGTAYALIAATGHAGRVAIHRAGVDALSCAEKATVPLHSAEVRLVELNGTLMQLGTAIAAAAKARGDLIGELMMARGANANTGALDTSQRAADRVKELLDKANEQLKNAEMIKGPLQQAGSFLIAKVGDIRGKVNKTLDGTSNDINQLPKILASIVDYVKMFTPAGVDLKLPSFKVDGAALPQQKEGAKRAPAELGGARDSGLGSLANALGELANAEAELARRMAVVQGELEKLTITSGVQKEIEGCGVAIATVAAPLKLEENSVEIDAGVEQVRTVFISGGSGNYHATPEPFPGKGFEARASGNVVQIYAKAQSDPGTTHKIRVSDGTSALPIVLTLSFKAKKEDPNGAWNKKAECAGFESWSKPDVCLLQNLVKAESLDGKFGPITCAAFRKNGNVALGIKDAANGAASKATLEAVRTKSGLAADAAADVIAAASAKFKTPCP